MAGSFRSILIILYNIVFRSSIVVKRFRVDPLLLFKHLNQSMADYLIIFILLGRRVWRFARILIFNVFHGFELLGGLFPNTNNTVFLFFNFNIRWIFLLKLKPLNLQILLNTLNIGRNLLSNTSDTWLEVIKILRWSKLFWFNNLIFVLHYSLKFN